MERFVGDYHDRVRRDVFPQIPANAGRVLDFGGGIGSTSAVLKADGRAGSAILFDQVANDAAPAIDGFEAVDLDDLAAVQAAIQRHGPFDTILCLDILEHLHDPWATTRMLAKALYPGGCMVLSVPNVANYRIALPLLRGRFRYADRGLMDRTHLRWFTRESAAELAEGAGLQIEAIVPILHASRDRLIDRLSLGALTHLLAAQYSIRARKP